MVRLRGMGIFRASCRGIACTMALGATGAAPVWQLADLSWLAGHWLACGPHGETAETWTDDRGGVLLGISKSVRGGRVGWEFSRIDRTADGIVFHASPKGQQPAAFTAVSITRNSVVFENRAHDFPQRVSYRRDGDRLVGRIDGVVAGTPRSAEWRYQRAALNAVCPPG